MSRKVEEQTCAEAQVYEDERVCYKRNVDGIELEDPECFPRKFRVVCRQEVVEET